MDFVLCALGTRGDVNPMIAIGAALKSRGHRALFLANDSFESDIRECGMAFSSLGSKDVFDRFYADPRTWDGRYNCIELGYEELFSVAIERAIAAVESEVGAGRAPVIIALSIFENGAAIAAAAHGLPLVRIVLSPNLVPSDISPPAPLAWLVPALIPTAVRRRIVALVRRRGLKHTRELDYVRQINELRARLGAPLFDDLADGGFQHGHNIALFPSWFSMPAPDVPRGIIYTDFLLCGSASQSRDTERALRFARLRGSPLLATQGSAVRSDAEFAGRCREIARRLNAPLIFVKGHGTNLEGVAADPAVLLVDGVDLERVLPECLGIVHHGGIGTTAHALHAGIPQIVRPMAFDQFDNGYKLELLGLGACVLDVSFSAERVANALRGLIQRFVARGAQVPRIGPRDRVSDYVCDAILRRVSSQGLAVPNDHSPA